MPVGVVSSEYIGKSYTIQSVVDTYVKIFEQQNFTTISSDITEELTGKQWRVLKSKTTKSGMTIYQDIYFRIVGTQSVAVCFQYADGTSMLDTMMSAYSEY